MEKKSASNTGDPSTCGVTGNGEVDGVTALPPLRLTPVHATVKWIGDLNGAGGGVM